MVHVKYLETDTDRLKSEIIWADSTTGDSFECVHVDFAREQEAEIKRLLAALSAIRACAADALAKQAKP